MCRDFTKLEVFREADALVLDIYQHTKAFPKSEQYGLQQQIGRGIVSVACNIR
jgi:four helix bundle protein